MELVKDRTVIDAAVKDNKLVVIDFMATWCRKCIVSKPKIQRLHDEEFQDIPFVFVDVNEVPYEIMKEYQVEVMPTFVVVRDGKVASRMKGGEEVKMVVDHLRQLIKREVEILEMH